MELFWDRGTKKANAIYCHPLLHDKINCKVSRAIYHPKAGNLRKENLGFELKLLRKISFTINARIDLTSGIHAKTKRKCIPKTLLLPTMYEHKQKWIETWATIIERHLS